MLHIVDDTHVLAPMKDTFLTFLAPTNRKDDQRAGQQERSRKRHHCAHISHTIGETPGVALSLPDRYIFNIRKS